MSTILLLIFIVSSLGFSYAIFNYHMVKVLDEGTAEMSKIALLIRRGANAFLISEYKLIIPVAAILSIFFGVIMSWHCGVSFIIGAMMSALAGLFGMKASTYANVRVTNTARTTSDTSKTLNVALKGGSVMGLSVASFSLVGLFIVFALFRDDLDTLQSIPNWLGFEFVPMSENLMCYSLGCSIIALFNRVGGGIYTKAADMGSDLVGKTELNLPEDDPRNPGVIADCVGDNVGDTAGLGSDILESNVGAIVSASILAISLFIDYNARNTGFSVQVLERMYLYPIAFSAVGLLACIISLLWIFTRKDSKDPRKTLNLATYFAAGFSAIGNFLLTIFMLSNSNFGELPFVLGGFSPFFAAFALFLDASWLYTA